MSGSIKRPALPAAPRPDAAAWAKGKDLLEYYREHWGLEPDGASFRSLCGFLQPVLHQGRPAMLKISVEPDEKLGANVMTWWDGDGAVQVLAHEDAALLMERATGTQSLKAMAANGHDDEASRILCAVAARLHKPRPAPLPPLLPLKSWFRELEPVASAHGGILSESLAMANMLLDNQQEVVVLHGDLHHENVLDAGPGGWLAIDPKYLLGDRGFDFANIFCNPDDKIALAPGRLARQSHVVAEAAGMERRRLLQWILAWAGLSAAWIIGDGDDASLDLGVAELALRELSL